jgi:hypothetical protein
MPITGYVRDIEPNQPHPRLELYFDTKQRSVLPRGNREAIVLDLHRVRWNGTMNSNNKTNKPYVQTAGKRLQRWSPLKLSSGPVPPLRAQGPNCPHCGTEEVVGFPPGTVARCPKCDQRYYIARKRRTKLVTR